MKKVIIALLAVLCFSVFAFANVNATPDEDWAEKMANKALLIPAPATVTAASGVPLVGDYYIPKGANPMGFDSLSIAVDSLNANGAGGMVNFILDADTLRDESFTFTADLNADSCVTVKPATGRDVVLIVVPGASEGNGAQMIGFDKSYVTFDGSNDGSDSRNLIVTTETDDAGVPFGINTKDAQEIVIKNLIIKNLDGITTGFKYGVVTNDVGGNSFTVDNCQVGSPEWPAWRDGVAVWGDWTNGFSKGTITNNDIHAGARGISTYIAGPCVFAGNNVKLYPTKTTYSYNYGIYSSWVSGAEIYDNVVTSAEVSTGTQTKIGGIVTASNPAGAVFNVYNNMVSVADAAETAPVYGFLGMSGSDARTWNVYHNTFAPQGAGEVNGIGQSSTGPITMDLKNNIIINNNAGDATSTGIELVNAATVLTSDNNILVAVEKCASLAGTDYADLADWQAAGQDVHSDSLAVTFVAADDLHLAAPSDENVALVMPSVGIAEDIDGDMRGAFAAYAGADEGTVYPNNDLNLAFDDASDVANWTTEAAWDTKEHDATRKALKHVDGGWGASIKRPVKATAGSLYKLTAFVETDGWDAGFYDLSVSGLGNDDVKISAISEGEVTELSLIGIADAEDGFILFSGSYPATKNVTLWIDSLVWDDQYMDIYPSEDIAAAKAIADYEWVACSGVVTATTIGAPVFMEDATGGIALYEWDLINDGIVEVGDEIFIAGQRSSYKGLIQIKNISENYVVLSKDNDVTPTLITAADLDSRDYQGMLVMIEDVDTVGTLAWPTEGNDASLAVKDANGVEFTLRIDRDGDMDGAPEPDQWPLDLVGVISEYNDPQVMARTMDDFIMNTTPGDFSILNPADSTVVTSLDDAALVDYAMGMDTVKAMFINWTEAVDTDDDTVTYELMVSPDGPEEAMTTTDTCFFIPVNEEKPYEMNGTYEAYIVATDLLGATSMSDTITVIFDFPKPAEITYAASVITDAGNMVYVEFDMCLDSTTAVDAANYSLIGDAVVAPTAAQLIAENAVMLTAPMVEDAVYNLVVSNVLNGDGAMPASDTSMNFVNIIPLSEAHPEDAAFTIQSFETGIGNFWVPTGSGSTHGVLPSSTFASSADDAFAGEKSGKLVLVDDPAEEGNYVRLYNGITTSIPSNSTLMIMVKGSGDVEMRLSVKDTGYEQGPWHKVTLCEDDWQVVSFDLVNDEAQGWITGNGTIEGDEVKIEAIHMRSTSDEDVTMYLDEMIARRPLEAANVTFNVNMKKQIALGKFNTILDYVDVAGSMNGWDGADYLLTDDDGDSTYSITFSTLPLQTLVFKFRINGSWDDATSEFPSGGPNREYFVKLTGGTKDYWYDDDTLVVEEARVGVPTEFALRQNYPNPFNPTTSIEFDMPSAADVKLVVYDVTGRKVRTLVNGALDEGYKNVVWNGRDDLGNSISTGLYIYRIQAGDFIDVKKMTFLK